MSQSGRQLSAHRDLVDPFRASHPYHHRIWFHEQMKSSRGMMMTCSPMASIDLLARDLRQIIEGPVITENSGPLSDKKMSSSIYYAGGWLWEGFREIRTMHLQQQQEEREEKEKRKREEEDERQRQQVKALQEAMANRKRSLSNQQQQQDHHHHPPLHPASAVASSLLAPPPPMAAQAAAYGFMNNGFPMAPVAAMAPAYYSGQMMGQYRPPPPVFMGQHIHAAASVVAPTPHPPV